MNQDQAGETAESTAIGKAVESMHGDLYTQTRLSMGTDRSAAPTLHG